MVCNRVKRNKKIVVKLILNLMTIISFYITKTHCINSGLHKKEQQTFFFTYLPYSVTLCKVCVNMFI